jgi:hypothetical protein
MSEPGVEPAGRRGGPRTRRPRPGPRPNRDGEGPPVLSLFFAAVVTFLLLFFAPLFFLPALMRFVPEGESLGPLALPIFTGSWFEALVGVAVLSVLGLLLLTVERNRPYPAWLPPALSLPVAWALVLPSALEHGGPWIAWLVFGVLVAAVFCVHWMILSWAREAWD